MISLSPKNLPSADITPDQLEQGSSLWHDAWARLRKNQLAVFGGVTLVTLIAMCVLLPLLFDLSYEAQGLSIGGLPPGSKVVKIYDAVGGRGALEVSNLENLKLDQTFGTGPEAEQTLAKLTRGEKVTIGDRLYKPSIYLLGSDAPLGRDLFARILYGGRVSIMVGLVATFVALAIGVTYGATAGFFGGKIDAVMMRIVDILYAMPFTIFVILLMVFFGRNIILLFFAIGAVEWLTMARIVRGQIMAIKKMEYIEAARSLGLGRRRIIFRHMIPNVLGPIIVYTTLTIPAVMLLEAFLSFLGLGVQPPMSSWGVLIKDGAEKMEEFWWLLVFPGGIFSLTLFSLNFLGDGLRDALDVRSSKD
jgi:oligopeptide transport system permease protein